MSYIRSDELLTTAAFRGEAERVREMLQHGAISSARDKQKCTALHWAVSMGHVDVAEVLLEYGADVHARSSDGNTPLHVSAREGDAPTAVCLLENGANPVMVNSSGKTALDIALEVADDEVELIHVLRTAQRTHEKHRLTATATADSASPHNELAAPAESTSRSNGSLAAEKPAMVSSGCGGDDPLPIDGPMRADMPDTPPLLPAPVPSDLPNPKPRLVSGGCGSGGGAGILVSGAGSSGMAPSCCMGDATFSGASCSPILSGEGGPSSRSGGVQASLGGMPPPPPPASDAIDRVAPEAAVKTHRLGSSNSGSSDSKASHGSLSRDIEIPSSTGGSELQEIDSAVLATLVSKLGF